jgi:hypothetical protein
MAALLQLAPVQGPSNAADALARLHPAVAPTLSRTAQRRAALVCHWPPRAAGRLSCHRYAALPGVPVPPH